MLKTENGFLSAYFSSGLSNYSEIRELHPELIPYIRIAQGGSHRYVIIEGCPIRTRRYHYSPGNTLSVPEFEQFYELAMQDGNQPDFVGLVIKQGEKEKLWEVCKRYDIPIPYKHLFTDLKEYCLWVVSEDGIGLAGTIVLRHLHRVLHGIGQLCVWCESTSWWRKKAHRSPQGSPIIVKTKDENQLRKLIATLRKDYGYVRKTPEKINEGKKTRRPKALWIYANVEGHFYWRALEGTDYPKPEFNRWMTPRDFFGLLDIVYGSPRIEGRLP